MTVRLLHGFTTDPAVGPYVRGRLALAGLDLSVDAGTYLDAIHAIAAEVPVETLEKMMSEIVKHNARVAPDRETWGLLPEHQRMSAGLQDNNGGVTGGAAARRGVRSS